MQPPERDVPGESLPRPRGTERVAVVVAVVVLFAVLIGGFARLGSLLGFDEPLTAPPPSAPPSTLPSSGPASVTGRVLPGVPTTTPVGAGSPSTTLPSGASPTDPADPVDPAAGAAGQLPPRWPVSLPDPGEHRLLGVETTDEDRWMLAVPGNVPLAGGRFVAALEDLGWEVTAMSTPRTMTVVAAQGSERVSVTLRHTAEGLPDGWLLMDVVYQPTLPEFEPPPSSTIPPENEVTRRS